MEQSQTEIQYTLLKNPDLLTPRRFKKSDEIQNAVALHSPEQALHPTQFHN